ncbi:MAG: hypothetical protein ACLQVN_09795 [Bryobacteraceae bacterium]
MLIGEAALAYVLGNAVCKQRESEKTEVIPVAYTSSIIVCPNSGTVLQALNMTEFIAADFSSVPEVRDVRVSQDRDQFTVEVVLSSFKKDVRRKVYSKQRAFYREFPSLGFSFYLVDASRSALDNAIA